MRVMSGRVPLVSHEDGKELRPGQRQRAEHRKSAGKERERGSFGKLTQARVPPANGAARERKTWPTAWPTSIVGSTSILKLSAYNPAAAAPKLAEKRMEGSCRLPTLSSPDQVVSRGKRR